MTIDQQTTRDQLRDAAVAVTTMLRSVPTTSWTATTPCGEWDLGTLAQHVVGTTSGMIKIGRREEVDPQSLWTAPPVDEAEWTETLASNVAGLAETWADDAAWQGTVQVGGETPAAVIGDMAYAEILLHGWDIARATGAVLPVTAEAGTALRLTVAETAELGRQMGAYRDPVPVPEDASDFEQALGLSGRDPAWTRG